MCPVCNTFNNTIAGNAVRSVVLHTSDLSALLYSAGCYQENGGGQNKNGKRTKEDGTKEGSTSKPEICSGQIQKIEKDPLWSSKRRDMCGSDL